MIYIAVVKRMHRENCSDMWMQRPLPPELLAYAAQDVVAIGTVYEHFKATSCVTAGNIESLLDQSARYMTLHGDCGRLSPDNRYSKSPFLPLDIITPVTKKHDKCRTCERELSRKHYETNKKGKRVLQCRLCVAIDLMHKEREKRSIKAAEKAALHAAENEATEEK
jgi:exonuclease 3'-5' domain-containing protein 1